MPCSVKAYGVYLILEPREPLFKVDNFDLEDSLFSDFVFRVKNFDLDEMLFSDSIFKVQFGDADNNLDRLFVQI